MTKATPRWKWYFHRLQSMPRAELLHRVREKAIQIRERREIARTPRPLVLGDDALTGGPLAQHLAELAASKQRIPQQAEYVAQADQIMGGTLPVFGNEYPVNALADWHTDPKTGNRWPMRFYADIDIRDGTSIGGVKYVWEVNRCHHLVTIAQAYWLSRKPHYADAVLDAIESWIAQNPYLIGVNWTSSLELALRLINWTWALALVGPHPRLNSGLGQKICQSMAEQGSYLHRHLSAYSSANNHLIGEAAGLATIGLCQAWLPQAAQWRQLGLTILEAEIGKQILPDGVPAEQAIEYLGFVLDFNLAVWPLAARAGIVVPPIWHTRLAAACDFLVHIMDQNGHVPHVGDGDNGRVLALGAYIAPEANNYRSLLASAAAILKRPELKAAAGAWDAKSEWLLGEAGRLAFDALAPTRNVLEASPASKAFSEGGYCTLRADGCVITFDCGPLGYLSTAAHGHADALSFTVSIDGVPVLVDPGTYAYQEGGVWRQFFRSTAAHNTIVLEGANQSEMQGTFLWGRKAATTLRFWHSTPEIDVAVAEHNGYATLGILHRRTLIFDKPNWLFVVDQLIETVASDAKNSAGNAVDQLWHFPAGSTIQSDGGLHQVTVGATGAHEAIGASGAKRIALLPMEMPEYQAKCYDGNEAPIQGWVSAHYGQIEPAPVLAFCSNTHLPAKMYTAISLRPDREPERARSGINSEMNTALDTTALTERLRARIALLEEQVNL